MGWLIAAVVLILIGFLPLGVRILYNDSGFHVYLAVSLFRGALYPGKKKKTAKPASSKVSAKSADKKMQKKGGSAAAFFPYVQNVIEFIVDLHGRLTVRQLEFKLILAGTDPCDLAVNYGRTWAAVGNLMPLLDSFIKIRKRDVQVECDFSSNDTSVYFYMDIAVSVGRLLNMILFHGLHVLRKYISISNKERAEYNHE